MELGKWHQGAEHAQWKGRPLASGIKALEGSEWLRKHRGKIQANVFTEDHDEELTCSMPTEAQKLGSNLQILPINRLDM